MNPDVFFFFFENPKLRPVLPRATGRQGGEETAGHFAHNPDVIKGPPPPPAHTRPHRAFTRQAALLVNASGHGALLLLRGRHLSCRLHGLLLPVFFGFTSKAPGSIKSILICLEELTRLCLSLFDISLCLFYWTIRALFSPGYRGSNPQCGAQS